MPFQNPLTIELMKHRKETIINYFPFLKNCQNVMLFEAYIGDCPQIFYCKDSFNIYLNFLNKVKNDNPLLLTKVLNEKEDKLSLAISNLESINKLQFHDLILPKDYYLSLFLSENILFNILKLWEGPFFEFLFLVGYVSRELRGKPTNLEIYDVVQELRFLPESYGKFEKFVELYQSTLRNGIGHGKVDFLKDTTKFVDKHNNSIEKNNGLIVSLFDDLLDALNGFSFAMKVFLLTNEEFINKHKINIPVSIMIQELVCGASVPKWEIQSCLESSVDGKKHLNIFIKTKFRDLNTLRLNIFHTGILASELAIKFKVISIHMVNKLSGLAMFNAEEVRQVSSKVKNPNLVDYLNSYEKDSELLFFMKFKSLKIIRKVTIWLYVFQITFPIYFSKLYKKNRREFEIISNSSHSKTWYNVVESKIVLNSRKVEDSESYVRENYKKIIKEAIQESKSKQSFISKLRFFPAKFVTIQIYKENIRAREWRNSKTKENHFCTLWLNNTPNIKIPIAFPKHTEMIGNYTILWNSYLDEFES